MERKLASIRQVKEINPIPNADSIEAVTIDGWICVSKKNEFKVNDLCVYFEIDSFLPIEERYEFLRKSSFRKYNEELADRRNEGFRLKTVKLRNQISQGLVLPISSFPEITEELRVIGQDLTSLLNVDKWDPPLPACLSGIALGNIPEFIKKTDEERIQNLSAYYEDYKKIQFEISEKLDGSSCSIYFNSEIFGVCSRGLELQESESNSFWRIANSLKLKEHLTDLEKNIALQGELIGEGIQGNPLKIKGNEFRLFNIWDIDKRRHLIPEERVEIFKTLRDRCDIKHVPIIAFNVVVPPTISELLAIADGKSKVNGQVDREGIVYKSTEYVYGKIVSFKVLGNKYLLKE